MISITRIDLVAPPFVLTSGRRPWWLYVFSMMGALGGRGQK